MIRRYAQYSFNNPKLHWLTLVILAVILMISTYQLLENQQLVYAFGLLIPVAPMFVFAKASDYKRKYLHG